MEVTVFPAPAGHLLEGPVWNSSTNTFAWVDILKKTVSRCNLDGSNLRTWQLDKMIGFAVPIEQSDDFAVGLPDGVYKLEARTGQVSCTVKIPNPTSDTRINDGKCDSQGRLWFGTMHLDETEPKGSLFRLDANGLTEVLSGVITSNGLGWSPDDSLMYHTDSGTRQIYVSTFDAQSGELSDTRLFAGSDIPGNPDGLCVDDRGHVWSARWEAGFITEYAPNGAEIQRIDIPSDHPTSCAFVGEHNDTLVITTAAMGDNPRLHAGKIFVCTPGTAARPEVPFRFA